MEQVERESFEIEDYVLSCTTITVIVLFHKGHVSKDVNIRRSDFEDWLRIKSRWKRKYFDSDSVCTDIYDFLNQFYKQFLTNKK